MVTARLTYRGHACFDRKGAANTLWLDLFLTDNPLADNHADDINEADYILGSHAHRDHLGDAAPIAQRT